MNAMIEQVTTFQSNSQSNLRAHQSNNFLSQSNKFSFLYQVTDDLMADAYLLCFDEFQVTDIADAMILKSLFEVLFHKGAIVIATSNR